MSYSHPHLLPTPGSDGPKSSTQLFEAVARLCQASQGTIPLAQAMRRIGNLLGSEITAICRIDLNAERESAMVIWHESRRTLSEDAGPFLVSFASGICRANIGTVQAGSVWRGTLDDFEDDPRLASVFRHRRLAETVVIPLDRQGHSGDFLELHFAHPVSDTLLGHLEFMGPVLAKCWKDRAVGLFSDSLLSRRRSLPPAPAHRAILSMDNPCHLSRAEYRVCLLLSRGLNNPAVLSELSITMATLRTDLRNIYAKSGTASQP